MRYLITGATGFIGGHLVDLLLEAGHDLVALVRDPRAARDLGARGVELVQGDLLEPSTIDRAMADADGVYHLAAWYQIGARDPGPAQEVNVQGTRNVLEAMEKHEVPRGVYTSTLAVNGDTQGEVVDESHRFEGEHLTEYDRTKWAAHHDVALPMIDQGLPLTIVMPGVTYGPGDPSAIGDMLRGYLRRGIPVVPDRTAFCFGHVQDTAAAHIAAMEKGAPGETYIVAGEPRTLVNVFELAERLTGIPAPRVVPHEVFAGAAKLSQLLGHLVTLPRDYRAEPLRVLAGSTYLGSNAKATRQLGIEHRPFKQGLDETLDHEIEQLGAKRP